MEKCEVCGRKTNRVYRVWGYTLCAKHMHQKHKYGKFLDNIPRTNNDLNDYEVNGEKATIFLYNQKNERIGSFIIDTEDLEKVKYHKWRLSHQHVCTGLPAKGTQRDVAHVVLGFVAKDNPGLVVDHINGNPMDNRKNNLRICSQGENVLNKSFVSRNTSGFIGISWKKDRDCWDPEIRLRKTRCHLGQTKNFKEAVYKRYVAEELVFEDFANSAEHRKKAAFCEAIPTDRKKLLRKIVEKKLKAKGLWQ